MKKSTAELWVKIIAILGFIGAGLAVIGAIFMFFGGTFLAAFMPFSEEGAVGALIGGALVVGAILTLIFGVVAFLVAWNLWKHQNWARVVEVVFAGIGVIMALFSLPGGIVSLIINGGVFYLLALNNDVVKLFK